MLTLGDGWVGKENDMKKCVSLGLNAEILLSNPSQLGKTLKLIEELENKGFIQNGKIVFEENQEKEVREIFDKNLPTSM